MTRATAYLPTFEPGSWPTDGNCYFRVGAFFADEGPELTGVLRHDAFPGFNSQRSIHRWPNIVQAPPARTSTSSKVKPSTRRATKTPALMAILSFVGLIPAVCPAPGTTCGWPRPSPAAGAGVILNTGQPSHPRPRRASQRQAGHGLLSEGWAARGRRGWPQDVSVASSTARTSPARTSAFRKAGW